MDWKTRWLIWRVHATDGWIRVSLLSLVLMVVLLGSAWVLTWLPPMLFDPMVVHMDDYDARRVWVQHRGWWGRTSTIELHSRPDPETGLWRWMRQGRDGEWYPYTLDQSVGTSDIAGNH